MSWWKAVMKSISPAGRESVLEVTCRLCERRYRIGEDSMITTGSHVDATLGIGSVVEGYPDLVGDFCGTEDRRERILAESRQDAYQIRKLIRKGGKRYWRCRYCNNQDNPNSYH